MRESAHALLLVQIERRGLDQVTSIGSMARWSCERLKACLPDDLPAKAKFEELRDAATKGGLLIVTGGTGSGKTTVTPLALACAGETVRVAMPGRAMVLSAVRALSGWGVEAGQQLRGESKGLSGRIVFSTYGALLKQVLADELDPATTVILDEFHELRRNSDLQALAAALLYRRPRLLVLASATMPDVSAFGETTSVHVSCEGRFRVRPMPVITVDTAVEAEQATFDQAVDSQKWLLRKHGDCGDACVLAFLPSQEACEKRAEEATALGISAYAAHSDVPKEDWGLAGGANRIVFCTRVLEASVTVSTVEVVVDSGMSKDLRLDSASGQCYLGLQKATAAQRQQRAGRAGRLCDGFVIRIEVNDLQACSELPLGCDDRFFLQMASLDITEVPAAVRPDESLSTSKMARLAAAGAAVQGRLGRIGVRMLDWGTSLHEQRILDAAEDAGLQTAGACVVAWSRRGGEVFRRLKDADPQKAAIQKRRETLLEQAQGSDLRLWLLMTAASSPASARSLGLSARKLREIEADEEDLCARLQVPRSCPTPDAALRLEAALLPLAEVFQENGGGRWSSSSGTRAGLPQILKGYAGLTGARASLGTLPVDNGWRVKLVMNLTWPVEGTWGRPYLLQPQLSLLQPPLALPVERCEPPPQALPPSLLVLSPVTPMPVLALLQRFSSPEGVDIHWELDAQGHYYVLLDEAGRSGGYGYYDAAPSLLLNGRGLEATWLKSSKRWAVAAWPEQSLPGSWQAQAAVTLPWELPAAPELLEQVAATLPSGLPAAPELHEQAAATLPWELPANWTRHETAHGVAYFHHRGTGVSQWARPSDTAA